MGLLMMIGQIILTNETEYGSTIATVASERHDLAPALPSDSSNHFRNYRFINYEVAEEFFEVTGLQAFDHLIRSQTLEYVTVLTQPMYRVIHDALITWQHDHPAAIAGFDDGQDAILARLIWMDWWGYYALSKYKENAGIKITP